MELKWQRLRSPVVSTFSLAHSTSQQYQKYHIFHPLRRMRKEKLLVECAEMGHLPWFAVSPDCKWEKKVFWTILITSALPMVLEENSHHAFTFLSFESPCKKQQIFQESLHQGVPSFHGVTLPTCTFPCSWNGDASRRKSYRKCTAQVPRRLLEVSLWVYIFEMATAGGCTKDTVLVFRDSSWLFFFFDSS